MTSTRHFPVTKPEWFLRGEAWLDRRGQGAWIALTVAAFVAFWPAGLAVLGYMFVTDRLSFGASDDARTAPGDDAAFETYRAETLDRLEEEHRAFEAFLRRLRHAKSRAEFDRFMDDGAPRHDDATSRRAA